MRTPILFTLPLAAILIAGCSKKNGPETPPPPSSEPTLSQRAENAYDKSKEAAVDAKDAIAEKLAEWKLTPADIKEDLAKSGRVVREKTVAVGDKAAGVIDNARLVTVINGKYVADKDLSALKINVDATDGVVTLKGSVASPELVGRAIVLALDTDGVALVVSQLVIEGETTAGSM